MNDIQQAREWAESRANGNYLLSEGTKEAVKVIQSLPDHWIDAEKVREVLDRWAENPFPTSDEVAVLNDFEALLTPPLPTLADLIELGNKPEDYQWMQCTVDGSRDHAFVIAVVGECFNKVLRPDGPHQVMSNDRVTPLPDLPKLEWPGDGMEDAPIVDDEPALPRPEDVPAGEPWIVEHYGHEWVGARDDSGTTNYPWALAKIDGTDYVLSQDVEVTLISRLVPEVKP